jgi:hypothetical protein
MFKSSQLLTILACGCLLSSPAISLGAVVTNGDFESGLTGWTPAGNAAAQGAVAGTPVVNPFGSTHALVSSGNGGVGDVSITVGSLESALNLSTGTITAVSATAFRGSAISQVLTNVNVGDVLSFSWNFLTNETTPSPNNNDFSFFSLGQTGGVSTAVLLANTNSVFTPIVNGPFSAQTGYQTRQFTFTVAGDYTLGFGAMNVPVPDAFGNSGLLIDQVSITAVPEPTSMAALGLGGLLLTLRRRRN